jgi:hypothetical protein
VRLDELALVHPEMPRDRRDLPLRHPHKPRPPAARRATLADVVNRGRHSATLPSCARPVTADCAQPDLRLGAREEARRVGCRGGSLRRPPK